MQKVPHSAFGDAALACHEIGRSTLYPSQGERAYQRLSLYPEGFMREEALEIARSIAYIK